MPRRSGGSREFWDADDLYEGHAAARERNREVYDFEDGDDDRSRHKGRRAGRQQKAQAAQASAALKRDYVLENYQKHYSFIEETVNHLLALYLDVLCSYTSLKAQALRTMVDTQLKKIDVIMKKLPDWGYMQKIKQDGDQERVAMAADILQKHTMYIARMSKIATLAQQLHPHLDVWYIHEGQPWRDGNIWSAFEKSCSNIPAMFPALAGQAASRSDVAHLLARLQDVTRVCEVEYPCDCSTGASSANANIQKNLALLNDKEEPWNLESRVISIWIVAYEYTGMYGTEKRLGDWYITLQPNKSLCDEVIEQGTFQDYIRITGRCMDLRQHGPSLNLTFPGPTLSDTKIKMDNWGRSLFMIQNLGQVKMTVLVEGHSQWA